MMRLLMTMFVFSNAAMGAIGDSYEAVLARFREPPVKETKEKDGTIGLEFKKGDEWVLVAIRGGSVFMEVYTGVDLKMAESIFRAQDSDWKPVEKKGGHLGAWMSKRGWKAVYRDEDNDSPDKRIRGPVLIIMDPSRKSPD